VDVDAQGVVAQKFNIQSIPTLILFKNGKEVRRVAGALDAGKLKKFIG
jgi:thioredoxin-like negative regulator of GroEL